RQEDQRDQGGPRDHRSWPRRGEGAGRRRSEGRQGRRQQGRGREDQEADRGRRRNRRAQVSFKITRKKTERAAPRGRPFLLEDRQVERLALTEPDDVPRV